MLIMALVLIFYRKYWNYKYSDTIVGIIGVASNNDDTNTKWNCDFDYDNAK